jgi:hypothetical protein
MCILENKHRKIGKMQVLLMIWKKHVSELYHTWECHPGQLTRMSGIS